MMQYGCFQMMKATGWNMASPVVHLRGSDSSIGRATISRLLRTDAKIVIPNVDYQWATEMYSTELVFSESPFLISQQTPITEGHRVVLFGLGPYLDGMEQSSIGADGSETILVTAGFDKTEIDSSEVDSHLINNHMMPSTIDDSKCSTILKN